MTNHTLQINAFEALMADLRGNEGVVWKEVRGEIHTQYLEIAIWILLFDDYDLDAANARAWACVDRHAGACTPMAAFISYYLKRDGRLGLVDTAVAPGALSGDEARRRGYGGGIDWRDEGAASIFAAVDSGAGDTTAHRGGKA